MRDEWTKPWMRGERAACGRWLVVELQDVSASGKTYRWNVRSTRGGGLLGQVYWMGRWRCYVFQPATGSIWNAECLADLGEFLKAAPKPELAHR